MCLLEAGTGADPHCSLLTLSLCHGPEGLSPGWGSSAGIRTMVTLGGCEAIAPGGPE